jgi:hypothetical protein
MCNYSELASGNGLVYRNDLLTVTREQPGITTDLGSDLTLVSIPVTRQTLKNPESSEDARKHEMSSMW